MVAIAADGPRSAFLALRGFTPAGPRLVGAAGGEPVTLYARGRPPRTIAVASNGRFSASYVLRLPAAFVAQWEGDGVRSGDGTPALVVRSARRR